MAEEIKFPIEFKKCPNCGSTQRVAKILLDQEKERGKAGTLADAGAFMQQALLADPTRPFLSAPVLISLFDICAECGTAYCIRAEVRQATPQMKPPPGPHNTRHFGSPQRDIRAG